MNGKVKAGCEACNIVCDTFDVDPRTIAGFELASDSRAIPMTVELPSFSDLGLIERIKERKRISQQRERVAEFMVSLPTCGGPIDEECRFASGVEDFNTELNDFAQTMAPILPDLIKKID